jgi:hypothetical protein
MNNCTALQQQLQTQLLLHPWLQVPLVFTLIILAGACLGFVVGLEYGYWLNGLKRKWTKKP